MEEEEEDRPPFLRHPTQGRRLRCQASSASPNPAVILMLLIVTALALISSIPSSMKKVWYCLYLIIGAFLLAVASSYLGAYQRNGNPTFESGMHHSHQEPADSNGERHGTGSNSYSTSPNSAAIIILLIAAALALGSSIPSLMQKFCYCLYLNIGAFLLAVVSSFLGAYQQTVLPQEAENYDEGRGFRYDNVNSNSGRRREEEDVLSRPPPRQEEEVGSDQVHLGDNEVFQTPIPSELPLQPGSPPPRPPPPRTDRPSESREQRTSVEEPAGTCSFSAAETSVESGNSSPLSSMPRSPPPPPGGIRPWKIKGNVHFLRAVSYTSSDGEEPRWMARDAEDGNGGSTSAPSSCPNPNV